jgi:hypothetical protein
MSSNGQYQTAVVYQGNIWTSSDYGATWIEQTGLGAPTANQIWKSVSVSSTGKYQTSVVTGVGNIWTSSNYGITNPNVFVPGRMAIGKNTISDGYTLDVNGSVNAVSYNPSDYRIKDNVRPITSTIDELHPFSYFNRLSGKEDMGFIAHELQEHFPFLVNGEKDGKDYQSVNYIGLIGLLVKEIQDLKKEVQEIKSHMAITPVQSQP